MSKIPSDKKYISLQKAGANGDLSALRFHIRNIDNENIIWHSGSSELLSVKSDPIGQLPLIDAKGEDGASALSMACSNGHYSAARFLLESGANLHNKDNNGVFPLHRAASFGYADIISILLESGADVTEKIHGGMTALHCACLGNRRSELTDDEFDRSMGKCIDALIRGGANIEALDVWLCTPLLRACTSGFPAISAAKSLINRGANIYAVDSWACSPLYRACESGCSELVLLLLEAGAVSSSNSAGLNPGQNFQVDVTKAQRDDVRSILVKNAYMRGMYVPRSVDTPTIARSENSFKLRKEAQRSDSRSSNFFEVPGKFFNQPEILESRLEWQSEPQNESIPKSNEKMKDTANKQSNNGARPTSSSPINIQQNTTLSTAKVPWRSSRRQTTETFDR